MVDVRVALIQWLSMAVVILISPSSPSSLAAVDISIVVALCWGPLPPVPVEHLVRCVPQTIRTVVSVSIGLLLVLWLMLLLLLLVLLLPKLSWRTSGVSRHSLQTERHLSKLSLKTDLNIALSKVKCWMQPLRSIILLYHIVQQQYWCGGNGGCPDLEQTYASPDHTPVTNSLLHFTADLIVYPSFDLPEFGKCNTELHKIFSSLIIAETRKSAFMIM